MTNLTSTERRGSASSSKGNQEKWYKDGYWYKANFLGNEALAEELSSLVLDLSSCPENLYVKYVQELAYDTETGHVLMTSKSKNFLLDNCELVTFSKAMSMCKFTYQKDSSSLKKLNDTINFFKSWYGLDVTEYLKIIFTLDSATLDEDRHLNNLAIIFDSAHNCYKQAPLFDYGGSLLSDATMYYTIKDIKHVKSKPFSTDFKKQLKLLGVGFKVSKSSVLQFLPESAKGTLQLSALRYCIHTYPEIYI